MTEPFPSICVNWAVYDVPAIWAMVGPEREWVSREQTSAWLRTSEMLAAHQSNLQLLRDRVAQYWSPESSAASRILATQLDSLIDSVSTASQAARSNASAVSLLTDALMEAKERVQPLYDAWGAATTDADRARLNKQAWTVMGEADSRVIEHASLLAVPPEYTPPEIRSGSKGRVPVDTPGRWQPAIRAAAIPPLREPPHFTQGQGTAPVGSDDGPDKASPRPMDPVLAAGGRPPAGLPTSSSADQEGSHSRVQFVAAPAGRALPAGGVLGVPTAPARALGPRTSVGGAFGGEPGRGGPVPSDGVIGGRPAGTARAGQVVQDGAGEPRESGLLGGGLGAGGLRPIATSRRQYPADEEWEMPTGVEPVIKPGPEPDPKTAFDPGPNVIGLPR
jgi:hypothetical protein